MGEISQFGSHTEISNDNRLDALNSREELPSAVTKSREARKLLKQEARDNTWPLMPESITSVELFF